MPKFAFATVAAITALFAPLFASSAQAHSYRAGALIIDHPWAPATQTGSPVGTAYMTITNAAPVPTMLLGAQTPVADKVEIHSMSMDGGIMRMRPLPGGVVIPAKGHITFGPSSFHMMLLGMRQTLSEEQMVPMTLTFQGGLTVNIDLYVEAAPTGGGHHH